MSVRVSLLIQYCIKQDDTLKKAYRIVPNSKFLIPWHWTYFFTTIDIHIAPLNPDNSGYQVTKWGAEILMFKNKLNEIKNNTKETKK